MTTVILTMTDKVERGFNHLAEGNMFFFFFLFKCTSQSDSGHTWAIHGKIEKSLVCGDSV